MAHVPGHARKRPPHATLPWLLVTLVVLLIAAAAITGAAMSRPRPTIAAAVTHPVPRTPLRVVATSPAPGAQSVLSGQALTVTVSTPLSPYTPPPTLTPPLTGNWVLATPTVLQFLADEPLLPGSTEKLTVPGGPAGLMSAAGQRLPAAVSVPFTVAPPSMLRMQQLLAELGYLPLSFTPSVPLASLQDLAEPQAGTFSWRWSGLPDALTSQWAPGTGGVITRGAVMRFETVEGLTTTGTTNPLLWQTLLAAAASHSVDPDPYDYVYVSTTLPETATVYRDGSPVYRTLANTGIPAAPTELGTYPVYLRYVVTTMSGTNPTGSHYSDPGIPWVSYFNGGDALHGFIRGSYGWPQSLGCVEMPPDNAEIVWPLTPIGTLVTVA
jgi:peptidoglycan hydrolase-like protein with peptidoglycan-binding domain